jgi:FkbM family methyltransferase
MLNGRHPGLIIRNVVRPENYIALSRMSRTYERPMMVAYRYFLGRGSYPCLICVKTPIGSKSVTLFNSQDAVTLHEVFCREDYKSPSTPKVVVDIGSNIGLSALYFLTRSPSVYCELYEPDPRNIPKLFQNLKNFADRFTFHETAVANRQGTLSFAREPTGRYGSLETSTWVWTSPPSIQTDKIDVRVEHINTVLRRAIALHGTVDLLKIDTEGSELSTVLAIDLSLRAHVRNIVIEWPDKHLKVDGFRAASSCDTIMFTNKAGKIVT